jgi:hypothetical protein
MCQYAAQDVEVLSLRQMLSFGRNAWNDPDKVLKSARYVQREVRREVWEVVTSRSYLVCAVG